MSTSIAALVAIIASIFWFTFAPERATAAETLARAAAATQAYHGWVRIRYNSDAAATQPNMPTSADMYFDKATGTTIHDNNVDGHREVQMWDIPTKQEVTYNSAKGEILIGDITESFARGWAQEMMKYPLTLAETIASLQEHGDEKPAVRELNDNGLKRLDLDFRKRVPTTSSTQEQTQQPTSATIWVDPKTNLIQKTSVVMDDGEHEAITYAYVPPIKDLYALGVPRDTKIVDNRIKGDVNELFERLEKRYEKGFGDFVALESEMDVDHPDKPDREGAVIVYAAQGRKWFRQRFLVGRKQYGPGQPRDVAVEPLDTWPPSDCKVVLDRLRDALPSDFTVSDGKTVWQGGGASRRDYYSRALEGRMEQTIPFDRAQMSLPGIIWPTRTRMGLSGADAKASLLTDQKKQLGKTGLHVEQYLFNLDTTKQLDVSDFWLDPSRDDMPIECTTVQYEKDGKSIGSSSTTNFLDWKQLPNGQWYPTRWTSDFTMNDSGRSVHSKQAFELVMCPGLQLADEWFADPGRKK